MANTIYSSVQECPHCGAPVKSNGRSPVDVCEYCHARLIPDNSGENVSAWLSRAFMLIGEGDFWMADELLEQVLNVQPETALAYIGKLMVELMVETEEELPLLCRKPLEEYANYEKAYRFGDAELRVELDDWNVLSKARLEREAEEERIRRVREIEEQQFRYKKMQQEDALIKIGQFLLGAFFGVILGAIFGVIAGLIIGLFSASAEVGVTVFFICIPIGAVWFGIARAKNF